MTCCILAKNRAKLCFGLCSVIFYFCLKRVSLHHCSQCNRVCLDKNMMVSLCFSKWHWHQKLIHFNAEAHLVARSCWATHKAKLLIEKNQQCAVPHSVRWEISYFCICLIFMPQILHNAQCTIHDNILVWVGCIFSLDKYILAAVPCYLWDRLASQPPTVLQ